MRFLKIARRPAWYSAAFYAARPDLESQDFATQFAAYCGDFFGPVDTWSHSMRAQGIEATDLICGVPQLDRAWWREHFGDRAFDPGNVLTEQIKEHRPDVLFLEGIEIFTPAEIKNFRGLLPQDGLICGLTGTDIRSNPALYMMDAVFSCMKGLVRDLKEQGKAAFFLPHSFDPRILDHFPDRAEATESVNMIGNFVSGNHMHDFRIEVVETLVRDHGITVYSNYENNRSKVYRRFAASKAAFHIGRLAKIIPGAANVAPRKLKTAMEWQQAPRFHFSSLIAQAARQGAYGLAQYELLRHASATVNVHAGLADDYAANMRLFEATGIGVGLVTDRKSDLQEFFEEDSEVVTFSSAAEASDKVGFLMENPQIARKIGEAGQARTLRDHTFSSRLPILLDGLAAVGGREL